MHILSPWWLSDCHGDSLSTESGRDALCPREPLCHGNVLFLLCIRMIATFPSFFLLVHGSMFQGTNPPLAGFSAETAMLLWGCPASTAHGAPPLRLALWRAASQACVQHFDAAGLFWAGFAYVSSVSFTSLSYCLGSLKCPSLLTVWWDSPGIWCVFHYLQELKGRGILCRLVMPKAQLRHSSICTPWQCYGWEVDEEGCRDIWVQAAVMTSHTWRPSWLGLLIKCVGHSSAMWIKDVSFPVYLTPGEASPLRLGRSVCSRNQCLVLTSREKDDYGEWQMPSWQGWVCEVGDLVQPNPQVFSSSCLCLGGRYSTLVEFWTSP